MTKTEAIEVIKANYPSNVHQYTDLREALKIAINALKEQEPVKAIKQGDDSYLCDNCGETVGWEEMKCYGFEKVKYKYCPYCGRKIKWT